MGVGPRRTPAQRSSLAYVLSTSGESRSRVRIRVPLRAQIESASLSEPAALPPGIASVLAVLSSSAVVLDNEDRVLQASAAAQAFGLVSGDQLVVQELVALARQVRRDGEIREGELDVSTTGVHRRVTSLAVRAAPLDPAVGGGGLVLLLVEDQTESRRVEEVRRDFVANTSHELKTPVGALALLAETVDRRNLRRAISEQLSQEVSGTPLHLLLDDVAGATLIAGFTFFKWADEFPGMRDRLETSQHRDIRGICSGFSDGSSALRSDGTLHGVSENTPVAPPLADAADPLSWHELDEPPRFAMRRARRIDVWQVDERMEFDAMFRDSSGHRPGARRSCTSTRSSVPPTG